MNALTTQSIRLSKGNPKRWGYLGRRPSVVSDKSNVDFRGAVDFADSMKSELLL
jgi:hypothetical protein